MLYQPESVRPFEETMLQLHFYSDHAGRLVLGGGASNWWNVDIYPRESIKEFEQVSQNWKQFLADLLKRGEMELICLIGRRRPTDLDTNSPIKLF